jgi:Enoyl-CoA hydratase/isomerase
LLSAEALAAELSSDAMPERSGAVEVRLADVPSPPPSAATVGRRRSLPFVVVGVTPGDVDSAELHPAWGDLCDVVVSEADGALDAVRSNLERHPMTATVLALLLRGQEGRSVDDGLVAESAAYSVLQAGPEFAEWRAAHPAREGRDDRPRVQVERAGSTLTLTLSRAQRLNALDTRMRDELVEALTLAAADSDITRVELRGEGNAFCAGGDLDEFGSRSDPASAHLIRLERSVARALAWLDKDTVAQVHGACVGSGIELAAFCASVVAAPDTRIALPEIELGLVPGAGGTVSVLRRIGRLRTAWLAFSGATIDATTAQSWGLVDAIST